MRLKNMNRNLLRTFIFAALSLGVLWFIFSQSVLSGEESGGLSLKVVDILRPILDPNGLLSEETFHHLIRKAAHFTEFAALGCCICGFTVNLGNFLGRKYAVFPLFLCLLSAVSDEFLQYFSGRGSAVTDVVIDFSGSVFGILLVWLFCFVFTRKSLN